MIKKINEIKLDPYPRIETRIINGIKYDSYIIGEIKMEDNTQECAAYEKSTVVRGFLEPDGTDTYKFDSEARYFNSLEFSIRDKRISFTKKQAERVLSIIEEYLATRDKIQAKIDVQTAEQDIKEIRKERNEAKTND